MVRIVFSKVAVLDLKDIVAYIKRGSVKYAIAERKKIEEAIDKLSDYPLLGRIVPEVNDEKVREMIFGNYRIIYYLVSEKRIDILTIHHHARSLSNNPAFKEDNE